MLNVYMIRKPNVLQDKFGFLKALAVHVANFYL